MEHKEQYKPDSKLLCLLIEQFFHSSMLVTALTCLLTVPFSGMIMRLWNYVSTFSNLSGERLRQIYSKLKQEQEEDGGVGSSHGNGSAWGAVDKDCDPGQFSSFHRHGERPPRGYKNMSAYQTAETVSKSHDAGKFEAWKRRRRADFSTHSSTPPLFQRPMSNGSRIPDPNSLGILGSGPADNRRFGNEKPARVRQSGYPPRQGFSSVIK